MKYLSKIISYLFFFCFAAINCKDIDNPNSKPSAYALTLPVTNNDALGVTLNAKIINPQGQNISGYGFIVSTLDHTFFGQYQDLFYPVISIQDELMTYRMTSGLFKAKLHVYAYVIINGEKVIFNSVSFAPLRTTGFSILKTWPSIVEGDTVFLETDYPLSPDAKLNIEYSAFGATRYVSVPVISVNGSILVARMPYLEDLIASYVIPTIIDNSFTFISGPNSLINFKVPQIILTPEIPINKSVGYPILDIPAKIDLVKFGFLDGITDQFTIANDSIFFRSPKIFRTSHSFIYIGLPGRATTYNQPAVLPTMLSLSTDTLTAGDTLRITINDLIDQVYNFPDEVTVTYASSSENLIYLSYQDSTFSYLIPAHFNATNVQETLQSNLIKNDLSLSVKINN